MLCIRASRAGTIAPSRSRWEIANLASGVSALASLSRKRATSLWCSVACLRTSSSASRASPASTLRPSCSSSACITPASSTTRAAKLSLDVRAKARTSLTFVLTAARSSSSNPASAHSAIASATMALVGK